jgi:hypothetical protein
VVGACHVVVGVWAGDDVGPVGRGDCVGGAEVLVGYDSVGVPVGAGEVAGG